MNEVDDTILDYYKSLENPEARIALPPQVVWYMLVEDIGVIEKSPETISRRMKRLSKIDMLDRVDDKRAYYKLTDFGLQYLDGDLDRDDIPRP